jgi:hypothetical protein
MITIDPRPEAAFINPPTDLTFTCAEADTFAFGPLDYSNNATGSCLIQGNVLPTVVEVQDNCEGTITATWEFTDSCDRTITHVQTITIDPPPEPAFINPPTDLTVTCAEADTFAFDPLDYSNNATGSCLIEGNEPPTVVEILDNCEGTITATWEFTDSCDRTITHVQTITIDPPPEPAFINPPTDLTVTCAEADTFAFDPLDYSNNATGSCLIQGNVPPTVVEIIDNCEGTITATWEFTDSCDRTITHVQTITIDPPPEPAFINPPTDLTFTCAEADTFAFEPLDYSNNATGSCLIQGNVPPTVVEVLDNCEGTITAIWEFTDSCDRTITHVQTITIDPPPEPAFINPPTDLTFTCAEADTFAFEPLDYSNNATGSCLIQGNVPPTVVEIIDNCEGTITATWEFTDSCDRTITHIQTITIDPPPEPAFINPPTDLTFTCAEADTFAFERPELLVERATTIHR